MENSSTPTVWVMTAEYEPSILGGLGTVATQLTKALNQENIKLRVITKRKGSSIHSSTKNDVNIVRIPQINRYFSKKDISFKPAAIQALRNRHSAIQPDLIHIHSLEFARAAAWLKRTRRIPLLYTCHSLVSSGTKRRNLRKQHQDLLFRIADHIIVPSRWLKKEIIKKRGVASSKITIIPHGVDTVSEGAKAPPHQLLFVGRLVSGKGIEELIMALPALSKANRRVRLTIIGKGSIRTRIRLLALARKYKVRSKVNMLGSYPHDKLQRMYSFYGAVIVPSKEESFCLVALEAMANGIPLVTTRAGGLREFANSRNSQIITSVNSKAIARAVLSMWRDPGKTAERIQQAKATARKYNWQTTAERYKYGIIRTLQKSGRIQSEANES